VYDTETFYALHNKSEKEHKEYVQAYLETEASVNTLVSVPEEVKVTEPNKAEDASE
jgi:predicted nucleic acid-binding protein